MTKIYPFGKPDEMKNAPINSASDDTPQQKKFEKTTGKDSDGATGPVEKKAAQNPNQSPQSTGELKEGLKVPAGLDADTWAEAEKSWRNISGDSGTSPENSEKQIRTHYDQIVLNNEQTRKWEGKE